MGICKYEHVIMPNIQLFAILWFMDGLFFAKKSNAKSISPNSIHTSTYRTGTWKGA